MDDILSSQTSRQKLTDQELAEIRRRPGVRASLAVEGMYLTAEEEALFAQMDSERLNGDDSAARIIEFCRVQRRVKAQSAN